MQNRCWGRNGESNHGQGGFSCIRRPPPSQRVGGPAPVRNSIRILEFHTIFTTFASRECLIAVSTFCLALSQFSPLTLLDIFSRPIFFGRGLVLPPVFMGG